MRTAAGLAVQAATTRTARVAAALDIALEEYGRRYGDVRLQVVGMRVDDRNGVVFEVTVR